MAEPHPAPIATEDRAGPPTLSMRKQGLADMLEGKVEQGYTIEDRTDTGATLVTRGRRQRRWFGLNRKGAELRQSISINEDGGTTRRTL